MTEHHEKLVRQWRKEGVSLDIVCVLFAIADMTGRDVTEVYNSLRKHAADIKKTLYDIRT